MVHAGCYAEAKDWDVESTSKGSKQKLEHKLPTVQHVTMGVCATSACRPEGMLLPAAFHLEAFTFTLRQALSNEAATLLSPYYFFLLFFPFFSLFFLGGTVGPFLSLRETNGNSRSSVGRLPPTLTQRLTDLQPPVLPWTLCLSCLAPLCAGFCPSPRRLLGADESAVNWTRQPVPFFFFTSVERETRRDTTFWATEHGWSVNEAPVTFPKSGLITPVGFLATWNLH